MPKPSEPAGRLVVRQRLKKDPGAWPYFNPRSPVSPASPGVNISVKVLDKVRFLHQRVATLDLWRFVATQRHRRVGAVFYHIDLYEIKFLAPFLSGVREVPVLARLNPFNDRLSTKLSTIFVDNPMGVAKPLIHGLACPKHGG